LFVVPNIEKIDGKDGLDERLLKMFQECEKKKIPVIFGLNKFKLGKICRKKHSCVSMIGFVNVEGFEREFKDLLEFADKFREKFYEINVKNRDFYKDNKYIIQNKFEKYIE
jgi:ribosome biogenesis protein Tsr3